MSIKTLIKNIGIWNWVYYNSRLFESALSILLLTQTASLVCTDVFVYEKPAYFNEMCQGH